MIPTTISTYRNQQIKRSLGGKGFWGWLRGAISTAGRAAA